MSRRSIALFLICTVAFPVVTLSLFVTGSTIRSKGDGPSPVQASTSVDTTLPTVTPESNRSAVQQSLPQGDPASLPANQPTLLDRLADFWWVPIVLGLLVSLIQFSVTLMPRRRIAIFLIGTVAFLVVALSLFVTGSTIQSKGDGPSPMQASTSVDTTLPTVPPGSNSSAVQQPPPQRDPASLRTANQRTVLDRLADLWWVPIALALLVSLVGFVVIFLRRLNT